ncbi:hypothetical protein OSB04_016981 [Centaurea solstitialis]|uniref:Uncharacterized protein n=1 Tax=Centaurea solstitialis TaxID=347529 RepID=A0AA38WLM2_9ASTR|nr:hypothetical protein OSB04_016981 [Centaurea solstitialis]
MAANANSSFISIGSQFKPPTLNRDEFQQWKVRMVNFLEGIHPRIVEFLHNPPYVPIRLFPGYLQQQQLQKFLNTMNPNQWVIGAMMRKKLLDWHQSEEWLHLTMSMRATLDLEAWSLSDLFGSLASQESQVQVKWSIGGPLALVAKGSGGKGKKVKELMITMYKT